MLSLATNLDGFPAPASEKIITGNRFGDGCVPRAHFWQVWCYRDEGWPSEPTCRAGFKP